MNKSPRIGEIYEHAFWIDPNTSLPLQIKVTKLTKERIYYRPFYGHHQDGTEWVGAVYYVTRGDFSHTLSARCA